ncbi:hypothetical protein L6278_01870, partial [Candidatus Parcubacteria bacterium]|nr:hypothetical protein [Candidatus Parcubacteria bacterium]
MLKKILIFLIILILLVLAGVFVVNKSAGAQSQTPENLIKAFPDGCTQTDGKVVSETSSNRYIRMQIAIPGVTSSCVKDGKTYHYVSSNLPEYVKNFYNFAVGAIAIIAVIMIMIGGLQWIFAAGNPGAITTAKSNILSAISGLVLILFSYVLLYTINPNLVNLSLTQPTEIGKLDQTTNWCRDLTPGSDVQIRLVPTSVLQNFVGPLDTRWKDVFKSVGNEYQLIFRGVCGVKYEIKNSA